MEQLSVINQSLKVQEARKKIDPKVRAAYVVVAVLTSVCLFACDSRDAPIADEFSATGSKPVVIDKLKQQAMQWVYIDNGAIQCEHKGKPLQQTRQQLQDAGFDLGVSQCATITGSMVAAVCGIKDLGIHMHEVSKQDVKKARSLGFEPMSSLSHHGDKSFQKVDCP